MKTDRHSLLPALLLSGGMLAAAALSLGSSRSVAWALAGPFVLAATVIATHAVSNRLRSRTDSYATAIVIASAVLLAGALVAIVDTPSTPMIMPILGGCAVTVLFPRRCVAKAHVNSGGH